MKAPRPNQNAFKYLLIRCYLRQKISLNVKKRPVGIEQANSALLLATFTDELLAKDVLQLKEEINRISIN